VTDDAPVPVVKLKTLRPTRRPVYVGFDSKGSVWMFWLADDGTHNGIEIATRVHRCEIDP